MSIEAMKWAMDQTIVTRSSDRHVLLVMANNARDDGTAAFPAVTTIARRTGLSKRAVQYSIRRLLEVGAIRPGSNAIVAAHIERPDQRPNNYDLAIERDANDVAERGARVAPGANDDMNGVQMTTERGARVAPEPSLNHPEPSVITKLKLSSPQPRLPDCPHQKLIALYRQHLPHLAQPRVWTGSRATNMRQRWVQASKPSAYCKTGYQTEAEGLQFWGEFFAHVATGTTLPRGFTSGDRTWLPDLPWIVKAENFAKIVDGRYNR